MKKIVVADDSSTARMVTRRCLEIIGFAGSKFIQAEDGSQVLKILKEEEVDFVVSDLNMPVMDGLEMLQQIKSDPKSNLPILIVSSLINEAKKRELISQGAFGVLEKPISPNKLARGLKSFLPVNE